MRIRESIFLWLLCTLISCTAGIRSSEPYGSYLNYPFEDFKSVKPPKGYSPVYFSNISRHTSRFDISSPSLYVRIDTLFSRAMELDVLTENGKSFYEDFRRMYADAAGNEGNITPFGEQVVRKIAQNVALHFPELFSGDGGWICGISTMTPRTVQTMEAFSDELQSLDSTLRTEFRSDPETQAFIARWNFTNPDFTQADNDYLRDHTKSQWAPVSDSLHTLAGADIFERFFSDTTLVASEFSRREFAAKIYQLCAISISWNPESEMMGYLDGPAAHWNWYAENFALYHLFGPGAEDGGRHWALYYPFLQDLIDRAEEDMSEGSCKFRLRFVHDSQIAPFITLLQEEHPAYGEFDWGYTPMAANVQMILFRDAKENMLVRILLNEKDMHFPLKAKKGVYYKWEDFKSYLKKKIEYSKGILNCDGKYK